MDSVQPSSGPRKPGPPSPQAGENCDKIALHGHGKWAGRWRGRARAGNEIVDVHDAEVLDRLFTLRRPRRVLDIACSNSIPSSGTTGWNDAVEDVRKRVEKAGIGAIYASNFSPGANVTFALARRAGELFARFPQYQAGIDERHHAQKKDAPSGTAIRIAAEVKNGSSGKIDPPIVSSRVGAEFGLHTLFSSADDLIEIPSRPRRTASPGER